MQAQDLHVILSLLYGNVVSSKSKLAREISANRYSVLRWTNGDPISSEFQTRIVELIATRKCQAALDFFTSLAVGRVQKMEINLYPDGTDMLSITGQNWTPAAHRRVMTRTAELLREAGIHAVTVMHQE